MKVYEPEQPKEPKLPDLKPEARTSFLNIERRIERQKERAARPPKPPPPPMLRKLRPVHREMIKRLVEGQDAKAVAKDLGFSRRYIWQLKRADPLFMAEMERAVLDRDLRVAGRLQNLSSEALDILKRLMRDANSDQVRLEAAKTVLDRAGYSKLEKRVNITADAEDVIRALNRQAQPDEPTEEPAVEVEATPEDITDEARP